MMQGNKFDAEEVNAIFELGDINGDGQIDMGEFISLMFPSAVEVALQVSSTFKTIDDVKAAFKLLDKDGDGSISRQEMASSGHKFNISDVKKAFLAIDIDKDGVLSKKEIAGCGKFNGQETEAIFMLGDLNQDGDIDLEEFVSLMCPTASMAISRFTRNCKNMADAQQMFKILDKNGDGLISQEEMRSCGSRFNATEIEAIFAIGDTNNDGEIDINEFVAVMCPAASTVVGRLSKSYKNLEEIKQGFKKLDRDGDGNISKKEMASAGLSEQEVVAIFALGDSNGDGEIDLDEFIGVMCPSAAAVVFKVSQTFKGKDGAVKAFKQIDLDGDGAISKDEMAKANIGGVKLSKTEIDAIFQLGDVDKDGAIDLEEFLAVMVPSAGFSSMTTMSSSSSSSFKQTSSSSFSCTKTSSSSFSSSVSSTSFCSIGMTFGSVSDAKAAFRRFDINNDGVMDPAEMKTMMNSACGGKKMSDNEIMT